MMSCADGVCRYAAAVITINVDRYPGVGAPRLAAAAGRPLAGSGHCGAHLASARLWTVRL